MSCRATIGALNVARTFRKDKDYGSVERGKVADLSIVEEDPLQDIWMTQNVKMVVMDGKVVDINFNLNRNFALFPVLDWIAEITTHIPNKGEQLVRYYGTYSNVSRGKRKKLEGVETVTWKAEVTEVPPPLVSKGLKRRWSYFIRKV